MLSLAACGSKADEDKQPDEDPVQEETPIDDKQETPETDDASKDEPSDDSVKTEPDANKDEKPGETQKPSEPAKTDSKKDEAPASKPVQAHGNAAGNTHRDARRTEHRCTFAAHLCLGHLQRRRQVPRRRR